MKTKKGMVDLAVDEHPRPDVNAAGMAKLPPVFKKNGVVTAANASGEFSPFASEFRVKCAVLRIVRSEIICGKRSASHDYRVFVATTKSCHIC